MNNEQQKGQGFQKNTQPPPMADKKDKKKLSESDKDLDKGGDACSSKGGSCGSGMDSDENEE
jgi:hypothetical protein